MKIIKENINFERGLDPKKAMKVGLSSFIEFLEKELSWTLSIIEIDENVNLILRCPAQRSILKDIKAAIEESEWKGIMKAGILDNYSREGYHYYSISPKNLKEALDFERGLDPKKAMGIGFFKYEVEYGEGGFEEVKDMDEQLARRWTYNDQRILEVQGSVGSDHISMWIQLSDKKEFSVEANLFRQSKFAYLTIPSENIKDLEVTEEFFKSLEEDFSALQPVLSVYEHYFDEIEAEKEWQRQIAEEEEEELDEAQNFERGIDPKASMRIGMPTWETLSEGDLVLVPKRVGLKKDYSIISRDTYIISETDAVADLPEGTIMFVHELDNLSTKEWTLWYAYFSSFQDYKSNKDEINFSDRKGYINGTPKQFKQKFKLLSRSMNEAQNFERGMDPKNTMNIGKRALIENWLKENNLLEDAIINKDLSIDIPAKANLAVHLNKKGWEGFPEYIQFRKVYGGFDISDNKFTSLRGCPTHVYETENLKGSFKCFGNNLTSLKEGPKRVDGVYICHTNPGNFERKDVNAVCRVKSKQIWGDDRMKALKEGMEFQRSENPMGSMDIGFHAQIKNWFKACGISNDEIETFVDYRINKDGTIDFLEDLNLVGAHIENFPYFIRFNRIYGGFYVANNNFTNLKGFPKEVDGDLSIYSDIKGAKKWKEFEIRKVVKVKGNIWN